MNLEDFIAMGGYAKYVWPAYLLTAIVLILNIVIARRSLQEQVESARRRTSFVREDA